MLHRLKVRAESYDDWAFKVKTALEASTEQKLELIDLKELIAEASEKKFPDSPLLQALVDAVSEAEKCASVANQLVKVHDTPRFLTNMSVREVRQPGWKFGADGRPKQGCGVFFGVCRR